MVTHNCPSLRTTAKEVVSLVIRALRDEKMNNGAWLLRVTGVTAGL